MADRYWVGGTANWDGTAGTKWSSTSGGAGGASVPTTADDVFFDAASGANTVTIATGNTGAKSINCTGFTGTLAGSAAISVAGSITLNATMGFTYNSGNITISGSGTIISAGKTFNCSLIINGAGITVNLGDALNMPSISVSQINVTAGTFNTSNYNVTTGYIRSDSGSVRTINLGSSTINVNSTAAYGSILLGASNLTFIAGTSEINFNASDSRLVSTGQTFNNVSFTNTSAGTRTIANENIFNNISVTAPSSAGVTQISFTANQTINGTLSTSGTAGNRRVWFRSDTYGVRRTLTINSAPSLTDADFRDIIVTGTSAPISGTRIGNRGACSGITFSAPKTVYMINGGNWVTSATWSLTSGGSASTDNFPLAQDTAIVNDLTGGGATNTTLDNTSIAYPTIDMTNRTIVVPFSFNVFLNANVSIYGDLKCGPGTSFSNTGTLTFEGQNTKTILSAGKTISGPITIDAYGGTVELADALNIGSQVLTVNNGTFDTKNFNATVGALSSNNSNVRAIKFGSSTVTISGNISFNSATNLTFDAGTSQINLTQDQSTISTPTTSPFVAFYNVTYTAASFAGQRSISGSNIFNNLTFNVTGAANTVSTTGISANQTITGTLTVTGTTSFRKVMLASSVLGTPRTLTVGTLSAPDTDFRDIIIAGTAAGTAPTRAGDCGGNSGITFPAPKTVYRVGTNTSWTGSNSWALTSGGTGDNNNFPLAQDTVVIDNNTTLSGTLELVGAFFVFNIGSLDTSARTNAITINFNEFATAYFSGSITWGSGVTVTGTGNALFTGRGTMTYTSAGKTTPFRITAECATGTLQLGDAFNSTNTLTLTSGTFDAVTYNVTTGRFASNNSNVRTLRMGSGLWTLSGTATVWLTQTITNLTFLKGTADILLSDTSTSTRTFTGGGLSYNKLTIGGTTGTSTTTIEGNNQFTELASTKTVAHTIALGTTAQTFGKWTVTGSAGNVVTLTGTSNGNVLAGSATSGIDYLAMGSVGFSVGTPSLAEFYAGANSTGTATGPVFRTAPPAPRTLYWVGGTGNWTDSARWSLSSGGPGGQPEPTSLDNVIFDSASNATSYTSTINSRSRCNNLTISGPASGNLTLAGSSDLSIHGNVTLPATGLTRTYTGAINLTGSTTGKTFTTNGVSLDSNITVNGVGCEWTLGSALSISSGSRILTVTNGSFNTGNYNVSANRLTSNSLHSRTVSLGSSTISIAGQVQLGTITNLTFNAGTSQINLDALGADLVSGGLTFYNVSYTNTSITTCTLSGVNTFNNLTIAGRTSAGLANLSISANQTINGTLTLSAGSNATCRTFVRSDTIGTTRTLTCNAVSATDVDFRDITIAGSAAPVSGTRLGDCKGNSGITFDAPKTVYWNGAGGANWSDNRWAPSAGGTANLINFPLAQDTAVFTSTSPASGSSVNINIAYNIGTIDMSARTTNTMSLDFGTGGMTFYGDFINGTGVSLTSNATAFFSGRNTQTITFAGKSFAGSININSPSGTVQLGDALALVNTLTLTQGTFDAGTYNVTASVFDSNNANTRVLNLGSGLWTLTGTGNIWLINSNNWTLNKGTANILLSNTTTTNRTFSGGFRSYNKLTIGGNTGTSTTTITGNNTFTEIASTKTVAHSIDLGTTTQRVGAFTATGTAGNVLTITGTTSNLIYTGAGSITGLDYLNVQGRAYGPNGEITGIWNAGANSTNSGSLGWDFTSAPPPPASNANFFLLFA